MWSPLAYYVMILIERVSLASTFRERAEALAAVAAVLAQTRGKKYERLVTKAVSFVPDAELLDQALEEWRRDVQEGNALLMPEELKRRFIELSAAMVRLTASVLDELDAAMRGRAPVVVERG